MAVLTVMSFMLVSLACSCEASDKALHLKSYSEDEVKGCYEHNQTLAVCFDVKKGSMKILRTTEEELVHYQDLGGDMFYQILDEAFIAHGPTMFHVPDDVPREPQALRDFVKDMSEGDIEQFKALKSHYQAAMRKLHYVPEIHLLERVSAALSDNVKPLKVLQPFHGLCFNLLKASNLEIPSELRAAVTEDEPVDQHNRDDHESCAEKPLKERCTGMCGLGCRCWKWVCGDCCRHQGCYEHDICCNIYGRFTSYCALPFVYGFSCKKFGGYPACKSGSLGWRRK